MSLKEVSFQLNSSDKQEMTHVYKERAKTAFDYADVDSTGSLTKQQYKIAMTAVFGYRPDKVEVKQAFQHTDKILYEEFERWVLKKCVAQDPHINAEIIFALLDKDYKGYLLLDDFYSASKSVGLKVPLSVWDEVFKDLDRYKRGYIDFDELLRVLPT
nr:PREDICTED: EF-hand calcium-binding domain-containing protein 11-like [Megachile rotundata]